MPLSPFADLSVVVGNPGNNTPGSFPATRQPTSFSLSFPPSVPPAEENGEGGRGGKIDQEQEREERGWSAESGGQTDSGRLNSSPLPSSPPHAQVRPPSGSLALFSCRVCCSWRVTDYRRRERESLPRATPAQAPARLLRAEYRTHRRQQVGGTSPVAHVAEITSC